MKLKKQVDLGYEEANKVDTLINKNLAKYPISLDTQLFWLTYLRTALSSLNICFEDLKSKTLRTAQIGDTPERRKEVFESKETDNES